MPHQETPEEFVERQTDADLIRGIIKQLDDMGSDWAMKAKPLWEKRLSEIDGGTQV